MSTQNPLVPEGSLPPKSKSNVRIAIFTILAIHVVLLGGLLMQGCKREAKVENSTVTQNELAPLTPSSDITQSTLPLEPATTAAPLTAASNVTAPTAPIVSTPAPASLPSPTVAAPIDPVAPLTPSISETIHTVARNESFSTIAKKYHVAVKAIQDANPNVNPLRLQIGQKLNIPAAAPKPEAFATEMATSVAPAAEANLYVVKSGDALEKIARANGTTVKAIKALNGMKTDRIVVGQKLKMPSSKVSAPAEAAPNASEAAIPSTMTPAIAVPGMTAPIETARNTR